jgi:hypothetical protein
VLADRVAETIRGLPKTIAKPRFGVRQKPAGKVQFVQSK